MMRFEAAIEATQDFQKKTIKAKSYSGLRALFFQMQTLSKLYKNDSSPEIAKTFKKVRKEVKYWEDMMGQMLLRYDLWKAQSFKKSGKHYEEYTRAKKALDKAWQKSDWFTGKAQEKLKRRLSKLDWGDEKQDRERVFYLLAESIKKLDDLIRVELNPLITKPIYDYDSLEHGFHKMRRGIRWMALYFQNHRDLFFLELDPKRELSKEEQSLVKLYQGNKYAKLGTYGAAKTPIPALAFYEMSYFIDRVGKIKDAGEKEYHLTKNFDKRKKPGQLEKDAHAIYQEFLDSRFVDELLQAISHTPVIP